MPPKKAPKPKPKIFKAPPPETATVYFGYPPTPWKQPIVDGRYVNYERIVFDSEEGDQYSIYIKKKDL